MLRIAFAWLVVLAVSAGDAVLLIDAEFGALHSTSAQAIELGARMAADDVNAAGALPGGMRLVVQTSDNRGLPARAADHFIAAASRAEVVAVMGGKQSPVVMTCVPLARMHELPLLLPWSAIDAATEGEQRPSWIFRLSLRDSWAMARLFAACHSASTAKVGLLLPNNAWGRSCLAAAQRALPAHPGMRLLEPQWYEMTSTDLVDPYRRLVAGGADRIVLAANEVDAAALVKAMAVMPPAQRRPLVCHWGVTGGDLAAMTGPALAAVDLSVVQTFTMADARGELADRLRRGVAASGWSGPVERYPSAVGLAHAYDLTRLLGAALALAGRPDRAAVRSALEQVPAWDGVMRRYAPAFTADRREALDPSLLFMARFDQAGVLRRVEEP